MGYKYCHRGLYLKRYSPRNLDIPRQAYGSVKHPEDSASDVCIEGTTSKVPVSVGLNTDSDAVEVVRVEEVKRVATQLEAEPFRYVEYLA